MESDSILIFSLIIGILLTCLAYSILPVLYGFFIVPKKDNSQINPTMVAILLTIVSFIFVKTCTYLLYRDTHISTGPAMLWGFFFGRYIIRSFMKDKEKSDINDAKDNNAETVKTEAAIKEQTASSSAEIDNVLFNQLVQAQTELKKVPYNDGSYVNDLDYGVTSLKPIMTSDISQNREYLNALNDKAGIDIKWVRSGSLVPEEIGKPVDIYTGKSQEGINATLYICPYGYDSRFMFPESIMATAEKCKDNRSTSDAVDQNDTEREVKVVSDDYNPKEIDDFSAESGSESLSTENELPVDQLKAAKKLHDDGILSDQEYVNVKKKLLGI